MGVSACTWRSDAYCIRRQSSLHGNLLTSGGDASETKKAALDITDSGRLGQFDTVLYSVPFDLGEQSGSVQGQPV